MMIETTPRLAASFVAVLLCATACKAPEPSAPAAPARGAAVDSSTGANVNGTSANPLGSQDPQDIQRQRAQALVDKYLEDARRLRAVGRFEEAKAFLLKARETMPGNQQVLNELSSLATEMGDMPGTVQTYGEQMERIYEIRQQRAIAEVQARMDAARRAMADGNYDAAVQDLRNAVLAVEIGADINWGPVAKQARDLLAEAERNRDDRQRQTLENEQRETLSRLRAEEEALVIRRRAQVDGYMAGAVRAFTARRFKLAQELAAKAMQLDPTHVEARNLHNASTKALRETNLDRYYEDKRREFMKFLEESEDLKTPQTDILRQDPATWQRALARAPQAAAAVVESEDDARVRELVRSQRVPPRKFTTESGNFEEVKNLLQTLTGIPIIITPEAREVITAENLVLEMDMVAELSVENFLNAMVSRSPNLAWVIQNGVVMITTKAKAGGNKVLATIDVRDLVFPLTNFLPPTIKDLPGSETTGTRIGGEADEKLAVVEPDQLQTAIKEATGTTNWEGDGAATMEYVEGGYLIVNATPAIHGLVNSFLNDQRRFTTSVVTIDSRFLQVNKNFLQEIGVDFRGLGGTGNKGTVASLDDVTNRLDDNASRGLDNSGTAEEAGHPSSGAFFNDGGDGDVRARTENFFTDSLGRALTTTGGATMGFSLIDDTQLQLLVRLVEKEQNVQVVNSQILTVLNNERANVAVINQTSYVRDFDVEVAQASFIADPKVDVIQDGIVLDVRPVISHDRKHIVLFLTPTVAELVRPIPTFTTSLAGSTLPVTLQLPVLTVKSFATSVQVPDGGSVLIGGLREVLSKERRAEVPLLGRIPLLSILFKQEGVSDENSSLMVLVTARVTDVKDVVEGR